jgi:hypothetical protein
VLGLGWQKFTCTAGEAGKRAQLGCSHGQNCERRTFRHDGGEKDLKAPEFRGGIALQLVRKMR